MELIISALIFLIVIEHAGFLYLEMFLWTKNAGIKTFRHSKEHAEKTKVLAANQGLYNGFLAAGLLWGLFHNNPVFGSQIIFFFLACIVIAGIYGGITVSRSIFYIQALPALFTVTLLLLK